MTKRLVSEHCLNNSQWPEAVPEYMVCRKDHDFNARAIIISEWAGYEGPILDYGCSNKKVVEILNSQSIPSVGYGLGDLWSEIQNQQFKTAILHDVLDHIVED